MALVTATGLNFADDIFVISISSTNRSYHQQRNIKLLYAEILTNY